MIIPCIDLMDGKVVQLVQGREKALEGDSPDEMLRKFAAFPQIQVIDLDAAMGRGSNDELVRNARVESRHPRRRRRAHRRTRAQTLLAQGAYRVIVGTAAFTADGINHAFLAALVEPSAATASSSRSIPKAAASSSKAGRKSTELHRRRSDPRSWSLTAPASSAPMSTRKA